VIEVGPYFLGQVPYCTSTPTTEFPHHTTGCGDTGILMEGGNLFLNSFSVAGAECWGPQCSQSSRSSKTGCGRRRTITRVDGLPWRRPRWGGRPSATEVQVLVSYEYPYLILVYTFFEHDQANAKPADEIFAALALICLCIKGCYSTQIFVLL